MLASASVCRRLFLHPLNQIHDLRTQRLHDQGHPRGIWMNPVGLHVGGKRPLPILLRCKSFEKVRIVERPVFLGKIGIHRVEGRLVVGPIVSRSRHSDEQDRNLRRCRRPEDALKVRPRNRRVNSPEKVVPSERDDQGIDLGGERPVHPAQPSLRGIPGNTGIEDRHIGTPICEPLLQLRNEALIGGKPITLRQAVAKRGNRCLGKGGGGRNGQRKSKVAA